MKPEELMLGDWVSFTSKYSSGIGKIIGIEPREGMGAKGSTFTILFVKDGQNIVHVGARAINVTPVPLTKEILEKNGFVEEQTYTGSQSLLYSGLADTDNLWVEVSGDSYFEGELAYVHELQHALRLCGIEKKIDV